MIYSLPPRNERSFIIKQRLIPKISARPTRLTSLHRPSLNYSERPEQQSPQKQKSTSRIDQRRLRAKIVQILRTEADRTALLPTKTSTETRSIKNLAHERLPLKHKPKPINYQQCSLNRVRSICEARMLSLSPKNLHESPGKKLSTKNNTLFIKMCLGSKKNSRQIIFPSLGNNKTETCHPEHKEISKSSGNCIFGPWDEVEQQSERTNQFF